MNEKHIDVVKLLSKLNHTQKILLTELCNVGSYVTVTNFIESVVWKYGLPESTVRWNVKKLKSFGLLCSERGKPVSLNTTAMDILKYKGGEEK
ncbi:MAG: hypothetical protein QXO84_02040 [Candidatus Aenigmatarchaeota archaeon]